MSGIRRERLINDRLYAGADIHVEQTGVPAVRINAITEKDVNEAVIGVDPESGARVAGVSIDRCRCFLAGGTSVRVSGVGFVKSQSSPAAGAFRRNKQLDGSRFQVFFVAV